MERRLLRAGVPHNSKIGVPSSRRVLIRRARGERIPSWGIPLAYALAAVVLGIALPRVESRWLPNLVHPMNVASAIAIESSVASGMIALTGVVFALAFVMVQFGAVAYSPRLVPWISRDPLIMHAIGIFSATFLYALAALEWVDRDGSGHVPFISTMLVICLVLASVGVFVGLVQRLSRLQIHRILIFTGDCGRRVIDELYPPLGSGTLPPAAGELDRLPITQVLVDKGPPRAIQGLDVPALLAAACRSGGVIELASAVGDTVMTGIVLLRVHKANKHIDERELLEAFILGKERTFEQDPKYAIHILADIAIRALSPAVNDPSTAVQALDQIEDLLMRLGRRNLEVGCHRDSNGDLRLVVPFPAWEDFLTLALEEIRHYGASSKHVVRRLGALLNDLMEALPAERHPALRREQERLEAAILRSFDDEDEISLASVEDRQGLGAPRKHHTPA
jgi:uncharacterized membrane protein